MINLTDRIADTITPDAVTEALCAGVRRDRAALCDARQVALGVRGVLGMHSQNVRLISRPGFQHKLDMSIVPSFGLTLHHHLMRSAFTHVDGRRPVFNACPSAGNCIRVCVLNNNFANAGLVQQGWRWRTELLASWPQAFFTLLGHELAVEIRRHGRILFRPNVNSDLEWERIAPALVDGSVFGLALKAYGYTKHDYVLAGDGWVAPQYRVAYSWNEHSGRDRVARFLARGGSVGVVTDRWYAAHGDKQPIRQWGAPLHLGVPIVDADLGDEWMFTEGVVGDLAFKPRTVALRQWGLTTDFVVAAYAPAMEGAPS